MLCFFISSVSLVCQVVLPKLRVGKKKVKAFILEFPTPVVFIKKNYLCCSLKTKMVFWFLGVLSHMEVAVM